MKEDRAEQGGAKILVVDDDKLVRPLVSRCLPAYELVIARDGLAGLKAAQEISPDIIVADYILPKMNGVHLCRLLRMDKRTKDIPVILLSVVQEEDYRQRAMQSGASCLISKAAMVEELGPTVDRLLREKAEAAESE